MCRFLAHLGRPVGLEDLVWGPPHSLVRQSWAPRRQRPGAVNADGFGLGWYDLAVRPEPARWRSPRPAWVHESFRSVAGLVRTTCALAAVRDATPPAPVEETGTPPFTSGPWLFAHNGAVEGFGAPEANGVRLRRMVSDMRAAAIEGASDSEVLFAHNGAVEGFGAPEANGVRLRRMVSDMRAAAIEGASDSEVLFALALDRLDDGADPGAALASVVADVRAVAPARLNMVITDGRRVAATTAGDTMYVLEADGTVVVASEPYDEDTRWRPVPDDSLVRVDVSGASVIPLTPAGSSAP